MRAIASEKMEQGKGVSSLMSKRESGNRFVKMAIRAEKKFFFNDPVGRRHWYLRLIRELELIFRWKGALDCMGLDEEYDAAIMQLHPEWFRKPTPKPDNERVHYETTEVREKH